MAKKNIRANNGHRRGKGNSPRWNGVSLFESERLNDELNIQHMRTSTPVGTSHHIVRRVEKSKEIARDLPKSFLAHKAGSLIMQYLPVARGGVERLVAKKAINELDNPNKVFVPIEELYIGRSDDNKHYPLYVCFDPSVQYELEEERSTITNSRPQIGRLAHEPLPSFDRVNLVTVEGKDNAQRLLDDMHQIFQERIVLDRPEVVLIRSR